MHDETATIWRPGYGLVEYTAPTEEPITLAEVKAHSRIDFSDDDALIGTYITAARQWAERTGLWRTLVTTTFDLSLDGFPCYAMQPLYLPRPPLQSVTSIAYVDIAGVTQTWSASAYVVDTKSSNLGRIMPVYGTIWPVTRMQMNAVTIRFVAGYGAASAVPEGIKAALKFLVANWYENREPFVEGVIAKIPMTLDALFQNHSAKGFQ